MFSFQLRFAARWESDVTDIDHRFDRTCQLNSSFERVAEIGLARVEDKENELVSIDVGLAR